MHELRLCAPSLFLIASATSQKERRRQKARFVVLVLINVMMCGFARCSVRDTSVTVALHDLHHAFIAVFSAPARGRLGKLGSIVKLLGLSPPSPNLAGFLTVGQAARYLGVSPKTLRAWDRVGKLKAWRHPMNHYRLYERRALDEVLKYLQQGKRLR